MTSNDTNANLGRMLKQQRLMIPLTLRQLGVITGISPSYLGRLEKGDRFPSASILRRIAKPLGFYESELFTLAGYLSPPTPGIEEKVSGFGGGQLDPYVTKVLSQEPVEVQRTVIGILSILKSIARGLERKK